MSTKLKIVLAIILIAIIGGLIALKWIYIPSDVSVGSKKGDFKMEASALLQKFEANEDSANMLYLNKIVQISGVVGNVTKNEQGFSVYLKSKDDASGVVCGFDKSSIDITKIKSGDQINVKGICTGFLMDVVLSKCSIEK